MAAMALVMDSPPMLAARLAVELAYLEVPPAAVGVRVLSVKLPHLPVVLAVLAEPPVYRLVPVVLAVTMAAEPAFFPASLIKHRTAPA
jgi:hypothetical protein